MTTLYWFNKGLDHAAEGAPFDLRCGDKPGYKEGYAWGERATERWPNEPEWPTQDEEGERAWPCNVTTPRPAALRLRSRAALERAGEEEAKGNG